MPESTTVATELTSQYITQVAGDLESNLKEQERIGADIAALQQQLTALQQDHSVLVNIQQALGVTHAPDRPAAAAESAAVPTRQQKTEAAPPSKRRTRKTTAVRETTAKKPAAHKPTPKAGTTAARPTLVELIRRHLAEQNEPRSAAEISTALSQAHPERNIKTKVVRVTTEGLVAKSQAQRTKQGASVFYTAPPRPGRQLRPGPRRRLKVPAAEATGQQPAPLWSASAAFSVRVARVGASLDSFCRGRVLPRTRVTSVAPPHPRQLERP